jgi:hypothetical protein
MTNTDKCRDCGRHLQPADEGDPEGPWVDDDGDRTCDVTGIDHWLFDPNEPLTEPAERYGITLTRGQLEAWAGMRLTDEQVDRLDEVIPNSSIPEAISAIADQWHHITSSRINEWPQASMLRQVALVRDFGDSVPTAADLLTCESCDWHDTAATHEESMTKRVAHEANPA